MNAPSMVVRQQVLDPAALSLVDALQDDPFYLAISEEYDTNPELRRLRLAEYFSYSLEEARIMGCCVRLADRSVGAAAWLLPQDAGSRQQASLRKAEFLQNCLGAVGRQNYDSIVKWMRERSAPYVREAWYLSIVGIAPRAQGRGLGRELLLPTLAEADRAGATCYLETFSARNVPFYERFGFRTVRVFLEPTTQAEYSLMIRGDIP